MALTHKQEAFAQAHSNGMNQSDAYRSVYDCSKMTDKSVWEKASELAKNIKVSARIKELRDEVASKQLWTREQSVHGLIVAYKLGRENGKPTEMTGAIKELNAMHGFNEPAKIDVTGKSKVTFVFDAVEPDDTD